MTSKQKRGRNTVPANIKAIRGTGISDIHLKQVEHSLLDEVPEPPAWMKNADAVEEWNRIAPMLHKAGLLTRGCESALAHLCATHGQIVKTWREEADPNANLISQYRQLISEFGMTPASLSRVMEAEVNNTKGNAFGNNGRKRTS